MRGRLFAVVLLVACLAVAAALAVRWWRRPAPVPPFGPGLAVVVRVVAGTGVSHVGDPTTIDPALSEPFDVAAGPDEAVYVVDAGEAHRVLRLAGDLRLSLVAGGTRGFADGAGAAARFDTPSGLAVDRAGNLYVADTGNNAIRRVTPAGEVTTMAGDGVAGFRDGPAAQSRFNGPMGVAVDREGRVVVADSYNDRVRLITRDGNVVTLAGSGLVGAADGRAAVATFDTPARVAVAEDGTVFVADTGTGLLRALSPAGEVSTLNVVAAEPWSWPLASPLGLAVGPAGTLYASDSRGWILEVARDGTARRLAGDGIGFADGEGRRARFRNPAGLAFDARERLVVADSGNALVRLVADETRLGLVPPASPHIAPRFDLDAFRRQPLLWPVEPMSGPHEIAGTFGEARGDAGGEGRERFHAGIDLWSPEGTPVLAVREGVVRTATAAAGFGRLAESLTVDAIAYVHIRVGRFRDGTVLDTARFAPVLDERGGLQRMRVKRGARFHTGDVIGTVNPFNHVHLTVGWPGQEHNPLLCRLPRADDTVPPTVPARGIRLFDANGTEIRRDRRRPLVVRGAVTIVVEAWDRMDASLPRRRLAPFRLGYEVLRPNGSAVEGAAGPGETIRLDRLALDPTAPYRVYARGSGIPFYGSRRTRFFFTVTNSFDDGVAVVGAWDTSALEPGEYLLRVLVADAHGNEAQANTQLRVRVEPPLPPDASTAVVTAAP